MIENLKKCYVYFIFYIADENVVNDVKFSTPVKKKNILHMSTLHLNFVLKSQNLCSPHLLYITLNTFDISLTFSLNLSNLKKF